MNQENFHEDQQPVFTPEEQPQGKKKEGSNMRNLIWFLLVLAVLTACTLVVVNQMTEPDGEPISPDALSVSSSPNPEWKGGDVEYFSMSWRRILIPEGQMAQQGIRRDSADNLFCFVEINSDYLTKNPDTPRDLAEHVGWCFHVLNFVSPPGERRGYWDEDSEVFGRHYADIVLEGCGEITYETFDWGDVKDGYCELPNPIGVAEGFYGFTP